jgi:hypothetical protein
MVKWKEDQVRQIKESELSRRQNELSNVWLSAFFGNEVMDDDYYELQNHLSPEKFPDWSDLRGSGESIRVPHKWVLLVPHSKW